MSFKECTQYIKSILRGNNNVLTTLLKYIRKIFELYSQYTKSLCYRAIKCVYIRETVTSYGAESLLVTALLWSCRGPMKVLNTFFRKTYRCFPLQG